MNKAQANWQQLSYVPDLGIFHEALGSGWSLNSFYMKYSNEVPNYSDRLLLARLCVPAGVSTSQGCYRQVRRPPSFGVPGDIF